MIYAALIAGWVLAGLPGYFFCRWEIRRIDLPWRNGDKVTCLAMAAFMGPALSSIALIQLVTYKWHPYTNTIRKSTWWNKPSKW